MIEKAYEILKDNETLMTEDIKKLISYPTVSCNIPECKKAMKWLLSRANQLGFVTNIFVNGRVGTIEINEHDSSKETLGILAHIDVVPKGDESKWKKPPFEGIIKGGYIHGRGAIDDKGPLMSCLYSMYAIKKSGVKLNKNIKMIIGSSEEASWEDIKEYTENYPLPDFGFSPDGEFPITNIEKGYADAHIYFDNTRFCGGEFKVLSINGGSAVNTIPDKAFAVIIGNITLFKNLYKEYLGKSTAKQWLKYKINGQKITVTANGKSVHSSIPSSGKNALTRLMKFLCKLPIENEGVNEAARLVKDCFSKEIYGKTLGFPIKSKWLNGELVDRTTSTPVLLEEKKGIIDLCVNLRISPGISKEEIHKIFEKLKEKYNLTYSLDNFEEPLYLPRDDKFLKILSKSYSESTKEKLLFTVAFGSSYAKAIPHHVAFGPLFLGETDSSHQINEKLSLESLRKATKIYTKAIYDLATNEESLV